MSVDNVVQMRSALRTAREHSNRVTHQAQRRIAELGAALDQRTRERDEARALLAVRDGEASEMADAIEESRRFAARTATELTDITARACAELRAMGWPGGEQHD